MEKIQKIKGFQDIFSPGAQQYTWLEDTARKTFSLFGFEELRIPLLEKTELFARSIGSETDIVQKEMYSFADRKGRSLTLRPEATAGVARAYIENKIYASREISKLYTLGPMFRYERPQKGRQRQFQQINAEILGTAAPEADAELLLMLTSYLQGVGLRRLSLELNSLGCPACRPAFIQSMTEFLNAGDRDALCPDCQRRSRTNPLRIYDCKVDRCRENLDQAPALTDHICTDCREHFQVVTDLLASSGIEYRINPNLVRGLDYYQRTTFEVISGDIGAQAAVAGGGRYDGLLKDLGGPDLPGIGFACGMERLIMLLEHPGPREYDFFIATLCAEAKKPGLLLACELRKQGLRGETGFEVKSLKSQLRLANRHKARKCLLLGQEELSRSTVLVKDLLTGEQQETAYQDVFTVFGSRSAPGPEKNSGFRS